VRGLLTSKVIHPSTSASRVNAPSKSRTC
jgi:hypothetical protein